VDERRARYLDDLRGLIRGELHFDPVGRAPYAHDASLYEIDPIGVVVPRSLEELRSTLHYAAERGLPIHARGAGTGLAGESLGPGLVVDFSRHFRRIVEIGSDHVVVQPGVVVAELNAALAPLGRRLGPDPSGSATCTVGGMIASDSAGSRSIVHGTAADAVVDLDVMFANGVHANVGCELIPARDEESADFKAALVRRLALHLRWHAALIEKSRTASPRNRAGYALWAIGRGGGMDLARLIVGSEGTLALITQARLRTVPTAPAQAVVVLPFGRLTDAAACVTDALEESPCACELVDWRRLNLARDADPALRSWIPEAAEGALVVEFEGDTPEGVLRRARALAARLRATGRVVAEPAVATRREDCERLLNLRALMNPLLLRSASRRRPVPLVEDVAVPPEALAEFVNRFQQVLQKHEVNWTFHAHAAAGQTHARPFLDLSDPADLAKIEPIAAEVYEVALALGGTISGEHGCGLVRTQFLRRQYGPLVDVFREVKYAFDPLGLLNPGKIVGEDPHAMMRHLRPLVPRGDDGQAVVGALPVLDAPLRWGPRDRAEQIAACNNCGDCRTADPHLRMCPTFRALRAEGASPRAQVNLLRQIATGALDPRHWGAEDLRHHADLCVHCNLCRTECPAGIDVSSLMMEAKAAYVENHGLTPTDWTFSHVDWWARWTGRLPVLTNALMGSPRARWAIERLFGLSRHRVIPRARRGTFLRRAERLGLTRPRPHEPGPRVAYFVDVFANHFDQELAESAVALLRHAGVNVYVPRRQKGCGMPALVAGDLDRARSLLAANLRVLGDAVRDGYTVVCSEPTAALMLRQEALKLTDDLDAELVAKNAMDLGDYLAGLVERGLLGRPPEPIRAKVGYHQPCHLRALQVGTPGLDLLRMIPELDVEFIDRGCSGIAGVFGLTRRNFRTSLRAGRGLSRRLKEPDIEIGATECGTCRMQMEQGSVKRTYHPVKLLCLSYGLSPGLRATFKSPKGRHEIA
jgi:FAD/FMN-containing dehydrogenase/Fe-S oxidoreductase